MPAVGIFRFPKGRGAGRAVGPPGSVGCGGCEPTRRLRQRLPAALLLRSFPRCEEEAGIVKAGKVYWLANRVVFLCVLLICVGAFQYSAGCSTTVTVPVANRDGHSDNISNDEGNGKHEAEKK